MIFSQRSLSQQLRTALPAVSQTRWRLERDVVSLPIQSLASADSCQPASRVMPVAITAFVLWMRVR